jgi:predicted RNA-binding protein with RPS1 domain
MTDNSAENKTPAEDTVETSEDVIETGEETVEEITEAVEETEATETVSAEAEPEIEASVDEAPAEEETAEEEAEVEPEEVVEAEEPADAEVAAVAEVETEAETDEETEAEVADAVESIGDIAPKMKVEGEVVSLELFGAFVNIGLPYPALLHISQIKENETVYNVDKVLSVGQQVEAYILDIDKERERVTLTFLKPPDMTWNEINVNDVVTGKVVRLEKYGAFVEIGAERPGLIHVSELADDYVGSPSTVVSVGDVVQAKVIGVDRRKKQIDLSIRALELDTTIEEDEEEGEELTAMGMALRQAFENADTKGDKKKKKRRGRSDEAQSDIISRTLQYHEDR